MRARFLTACHCNSLSTLASPLARKTLFFQLPLSRTLHLQLEKVPCVHQHTGHFARACSEKLCKREAALLCSAFFRGCAALHKCSLSCSSSSLVNLGLAKKLQLLRALRCHFLRLSALVSVSCWRGDSNVDWLCKVKCDSSRVS